ncbi:MAG: hypothetical protein KJO82_11085 [Gammaproteobacteria bacterium]|nr:hypothetical protein [Gammaproteobacteria bacterium]
MKSPLFDALRQAQGGRIDDDKESTAKPKDDEPTNLLTAPGDIDSHELQLASTGVFASTGDTQLQSRSESLAPEAEPLAEIDEIGLQPLDSKQQPVSLPRKSAASTDADRRERWHIAARATPALCLLLAGVSAMAYFAVQSLVGRSENADLKAWSQLDQTAAAKPVEKLQPNLNRFPLIVEAAPNQSAVVTEVPK